MAQSAESLKRAMQALKEAREMGMNTGPRPTRPPPPEPPPVPPLVPPRLAPYISPFARNKKKKKKKARPHYRVVYKLLRNYGRQGEMRWVLQERVLWFFWSDVRSYPDTETGRRFAVNDMQELQDKRTNAQQKRKPVIIYPDIPEARIETPTEGRLSLVDEDMAEVFDDEGVLR